MLAKNTQIRALLFLMDLLERHPLMVKAFLRPLANAPILRKRLMVMARAYMGATAFEIHDVDREKGRIGIGGVDEIMSGSKIIEALHRVLEDRLGPEEAARAVYEMGERITRWEVSTAINGGKWAPSALVPLMVNGRILDEVQENPLMARFFEKVMNTMASLIMNEGGWGSLSFDFSGSPMKVYLDNSQEADWLGPTEKPVCHYYAGCIAGYAGTISGEEVAVNELACKATGHERCVFTLTRPAKNPIAQPPKSGKGKKS